MEPDEDFFLLFKHLTFSTLLYFSYNRIPASRITTYPSYSPQSSIHSMAMLSVYLLSGLPLYFLPFTVPYKTVLMSRLSKQLKLIYLFNEDYSHYRSRVINPFQCLQRTANDVLITSFAGICRRYGELVKDYCEVNNSPAQQEAGFEIFIEWICYSHSLASNS